MNTSIFHKTDKIRNYAKARLKQWRRQVRREAVAISNFFILLIVVSNLGAAKSTAPCEATESKSMLGSKL